MWSRRRHPFMKSFYLNPNLQSNATSKNVDLWEYMPCKPLSAFCIYINTRIISEVPILPLLTNFCKRAPVWKKGSLFDKGGNFSWKSVYFPLATPGLPPVQSFMTIVFFLQSWPTPILTMTIWGSVRSGSGLSPEICNFSRFLKVVFNDQISSNCCNMM